MSKDSICPRLSNEFRCGYIISAQEQCQFYDCQALQFTMGLIKDSIGSALGANRINNGLNGPFTKKPRPGMADTSSMSTGGQHPQPPPYNETPPYNPDPSFDIYPSDFPAQHFDQSNTVFPQPNYEYDHLNASNQYFRSPSPFTSAPAPAPAHFRPLALPQIANGDGQPFLRGYSEELARFGVHRNEFIELLDAINVAIIPNPEHQIFQKGANIAGWFMYALQTFMGYKSITDILNTDPVQLASA